MRFTPRPYQSHIIDHIANHPRCAVWAGMGMGKTVSTLQALAYMDAIGEAVFPCLVLAPLRVARSVWPQEIAKWDDLTGLSCACITGTPKQRREALLSGAKVLTMNYENLMWLNEEDRLPDIKTIVCDEATRLKAFRLRQGSKRAQALRVILSRLNKPRVIELTGTPAPNGLNDLWGQAWFLDEGERLGRSYTAFTDRWFKPIRVSYQALQYVPCTFAQREIEQKMSDIVISLKPEDWFDLKKPIVTNVEVELPRKAKKIYDSMERSMFAELESMEQVEAANAAAMTISCLQLANGAIYTEDGFEDVHDEKLDALESVIEEAAGAPVLVAYHFRHDLERLQRRFPAGRVLDKNPQTIADWNAGKIPLLFAHPQSAGHGLNLQDGGNILVFFGLWWALEEYQQIIERIGPVRQAQAGHNRPTYIYHIVAKDTVDELVLKRLETKSKVQDILLEAMKNDRHHVAAADAH